MCNVYRSVGCITAIKSHLERNDITDVSSVNELIAFQKNYSGSQLQVISLHEQSIEQEKKDLEVAISELDTLIKAKRAIHEEELRNDIAQNKKTLEILIGSSGSLIRRFVNFLKKLALEKRIKYSELNFDLIISNKQYKSINELAEKN